MTGCADGDPGGSATNSGLGFTTGDSSTTDEGEGSAATSSTSGDPSTSGDDATGTTNGTTTGTTTTAGVTVAETSTTTRETCWTCDDDAVHTGKKVGIGVADPQASLHIYSAEDDEGPAQLLIENDEVELKDREMIWLRNRGGSRIELENTLLGQTWRISTPNNYGFMNFSVVGSGVNEMTISTAGDLSVANNITAGGTIMESSSVDLKDNFQTVDRFAVLDRVCELEISEWNYIADGRSIRHLGPMAQDFHALFGVGADDRHISMADLGGVALASIRALNDRIAEKDARIDALERRLRHLEAELQRPR